VGGMDGTTGKQTLFCPGADAKVRASRGRRLPREVVSSQSLEGCKKRGQGSCTTHPSLSFGGGGGGAR
jgi:hypothetical protein